MIIRRSTVFAAAPVLAAGLILTAAAGSAAAATTELTTRATAASEVPTKGPEGASGAASFSVDTSSGQVCYQATASGLTKLAAAHIHRGASGVAGPIVVPLDQTRINSGSQTCTSVEPTLAAEIAGNPADFYFNVHTPEFPAGAIRGQLAVGPVGADAGSGGGAEESGRGGLLVLVALAGGGALAVTSGRRLARR